MDQTTEANGAEDQSTATGLAHLPDEVLEQILSDLPAHELFRAMQVSKRFQVLCQGVIADKGLDFVTELAAVPEQSLRKLLEAAGRRVKKVKLLSAEQGFGDLVVDFCPNLCSIEVKRMTRLEDTLLTNVLNNCPNLRELALEHCDLAQPDFQGLCFEHVPAGLESLRTEVPNCLTDVAIGSIVNRCSNLKNFEVIIDGSFPKWSAEIASIVRNCPISVFQLYYTEPVDPNQDASTADNPLFHLGAKLEVLRTQDTRCVTDQSLAHLARTCPKLKQITCGPVLWGNGKFTEDGLRSLADLQNLSYLCIAGFSVAWGDFKTFESSFDSGLREIFAKEKLKHFDLQWGGIFALIVRALIDVGNQSLRFLRCGHRGNWQSSPTRVFERFLAERLRMAEHGEKNPISIEYLGSIFPDDKRIRELLVKLDAVGCHCAFQNTDYVDEFPHDDEGPLSLHPTSIFPESDSDSE